MKLIRKLLIFIFIVGLIFSTLKTIEWINNTNKNKNIKEQIQDSIKIEKTDTEEKYIVDFKKLKELNDDAVAYLDVNNTDVQYVVVKGNDNDYYLNHNFYKEYNVAGWIFADYKNKFDGKDRNIIIYGHNMKDGSMFSSLKKILTSEWQNNQNKQITLVIEGYTITYQIFSSYVVGVENYYITTYFKNNDAYLDFLNTISERSYYNYDVELSETDKILTLSTCTATGDDRIVIHAKQIDIEENI